MHPEERNWPDTPFSPLVFTETLWYVMWYLQDPGTISFLCNRLEHTEPANYGWKYRQFTGYQFHKAEVPWPTANQRCMSLIHVQLVEIKSVKEHDLVRYMAKYLALSGHALSTPFIGIEWYL